MLVDIYPPSISVGGLAAALADLTKAGHGFDIQADVNVEPGAAERLDESQQQAVFRVAQESLRNAVKHSGGRHVELNLESLPGLVRLTVADDGIGLAPEHSAPEGHFGMRSMADVTMAVGGTLLVWSEPGQGTRFRMEIPTA